MLPLLLAPLLLALPPEPAFLPGRAAALPATTLAAASGGDELDAAAAHVRKVFAQGIPDERKQALADLVALGDPGATDVLVGLFATAEGNAAKSGESAQRGAFTLERERALVAVLERRAESDASLSQEVARLQQEIADLQQSVGRDQRREREAKAQCDEVVAATGDLFAGLGSGALRKAESGLWKDAEEHPEPGVQLAAVALLGRVAGHGSALRLHKLLGKTGSQLQTLRRKQPKLESDVHAFEKRLQEETARQDGRISRATTEQYDRLRADAAAARGQIVALDRLAETLAVATGHALAREQPDDLAKAVTKLAHVLDRGKGIALETLLALRSAEGDAVTAALRDELGRTKEPTIRAGLIDALAERKDSGIEQALLTEHLQDESWLVRAHAAAALATLRSRAAIPVLIDRLDAEEGRLRTDVNEALRSLTHQRFQPRADLWRQWWEREGAGFVVPDGPLEDTSTPDADLDSTFFGIRTESQRVLFVLDVSGSMNFSMVPRSNPTDDPGRAPDLPRQGEDSRLDVLRTELGKALGGIHDGGLFDLVLYASDVWTWEDSLVEMDDDARSEAQRFVDSMTAVGGTNIYGALVRAFDLAGVDDGEEWSDPAVDTMFVISDGRPSVGVTTDPDAILAYVRERNRNAGIVIHTIGLSGAQDAYLLRRLAEDNGGTYVAR